MNGKNSLFVFDLIQRNIIIITADPGRSVRWAEFQRTQNNFLKSDNFFIHPRVAVVKLELIDTLFSCHYIRFQGSFMFLIVQQFDTWTWCTVKRTKIIQSDCDIVCWYINYEVKERVVLENFEGSWLYFSVGYHHVLSYFYWRKRVQWFFCISYEISIRNLMKNIFQPLWFIQQKVTKFIFSYLSCYLKEKRKLISQSKSNRLMDKIICYYEDISSAKFLIIMKTE